MNRGAADRPLKIIFTNHNAYTDGNARFLGYFNTTFNQGIAPGDFIWPPGVSGPIESNPSRSKQIFSDFLDDATMTAAFVKIPGTNLTSAVFKVTTLDNPTFGVRAGQQVEILLFQINSALPTQFTTKAEAAALGPLFGDLAKTIADNAVILTERIHRFLGSAATRAPGTFPKGGKLAKGHDKMSKGEQSKGKNGQKTIAKGLLETTGKLKKEVKNKGTFHRDRRFAL